MRTDVGESIGNFGNTWTLFVCVCVWPGFSFPVRIITFPIEGQSRCIPLVTGAWQGKRPVTRAENAAGLLTTRT